MSNETNPEARKLERLLLELFQVDDASKLDFGIYRILAMKQAELREFLKELIQGVPAKLAETGGGERERHQADLKAFEQRRLDEGDDLDDIRASKAYGDRLAKVAAAVDVGELSREVFRDLYVFFKRYWDDGDFVAAPRYDRDQYAIPYDGSEIAFHWSNRGQYYVKSTLFFNDMTVKLGDGRLRFVLAAAVTDRDNTKAADGKSRRFTLRHGDSPVIAEGSDLIVYLQYGPYVAPRGATGDNAGQEGRQDEAGDDGAAGPEIDAAERKARGPRQADVDRHTAAAILVHAPKDWKPVLARDRDGETELYRCLRRYTKGNSADFFVHKNLRKFLRRELDFFIKNEVFDVDNIDHGEVAAIGAKVKRIRALRGLAHELIDWLHQTEEFQRRLFLKKKFVLKTDWCVTLDRVSKDLWPEIAASPDQVARWKSTLGVDAGFGNLLAAPIQDIEQGDLSKHPFLLVETAMLDRGLADRLIAGLAPDLDRSTTGLLVKGDNFQALRLLDRTWSGEIGCVYIDPPYNAATTEILYKNTFKHSAWLSMMENRLVLGRSIAGSDCVQVVAIDENEHDRLGLLMSDVFGDFDCTSISIVHNPRGIQGQGFSMCHESALFAVPRGVELPHRVLDESKEKPLLKTGTVSSRAEGYTMFYPIYVRDGRVTRVGPPPAREFHPGMSQTVTPEGEVEVWPIDSDGGERKWRYKGESLMAIRDAVSARPGRDGRQVVYLSKHTEAFRSVWVDSKYNAAEYGSTLIQEMVPSGSFSFPKSIHTVQDCVRIGLRGRQNTVLDYFGGSGTTGHAVINLNREDGGKRRFILAEMGEHFDTVLLPRILKATYSKEWKDGKPIDRQGISALYKVIRLESYDDSLENIEFARPDERQMQLGGGIRKDYLLRYMLRMEAEKSLLDRDRFCSPFDYRIRALVTQRDGSGASVSNVEEVPVDLVETFNYLLGLRVKTMQPLGNGGDMRTARYVEGLRRDSNGNWTIKTLVVWRDGTKVGDAALDEMFATARFTEVGKDGRRPIADFDEVYVNGDNRLASQRLEGERWEVTLVEEAFHSLMFAIPEEE